MNIQSVSEEMISENGVRNMQKIILQLNLARLITSTSYNNFFENIANNNAVIAKISAIKVTRTLISIYTDSYDHRNIKNSKIDLEKTILIGVTVDRTHRKCYSFSSLLALTHHFF